MPVCSAQVLQPGTIDVSKMLEHDVPVDVIVTPTQVRKTRVRGRGPKTEAAHGSSPMLYYAQLLLPRMQNMAQVSRAMITYGCQTKGAMCEVPQAIR